jgi:hypothetical protein
MKKRVIHFACLLILIIALTTGCKKELTHEKSVPNEQDIINKVREIVGDKGEVKLISNYEIDSTNKKSNQNLKFKPLSFKEFENLHRIINVNKNFPQKFA